MGIGFRSAYQHGNARHRTQLARFGEVKRGGIGIASVGEVTQDIAREQKPPAIEGAAVINTVIFRQSSRQSGAAQGRCRAERQRRPVYRLATSCNQQGLT